MTPARRPGRLTAWIAIFAMLLAALAPSVARALSSPQKVMPWSDICTVAGTQLVPDTASLPGSGHPGVEAFKHCPLCLNHAGQFALPVTAPGVLPAADTSAEAFPSPVPVPSPRVIRTAVQPRAPPANT